MKTRAAFALLLAGIVGSSAGPVSTAIAQDPIRDAACQAAQDAAIDGMFKAILQARGVPEWAINAGDGTYAAWKEYLVNPDGERLNKAALSATKSALSVMVPGAGVGISGSELYISAVEATIGEAQALQAKAFLCGGTSFGLAQGLPSFFSYPRVQQIAPGVTCENFADRVTTYQQLTQMKEFWEGYYAGQVRERAGNDLDTNNRLGQAWFTLQQQWAGRWAATEYARIRDEMLRSASGGSQQSQQCARPPALQAASYMDPRTPEGRYVDRCFAYASQCDDNNSTYKPSADAFCKSKGHSGVVQDAAASRWSYKAPTQIQSGGQLCNDAGGCGGLDWVSCQ